MGDEIIRVIPLPPTVEAFVMDDEDGNHNIYVNANLSVERQKKAVEHERKHIKKDHLYSTKPVALCEKEAKV